MSVTALFLLFSLGIAMTVQDCSRPLGGPNMDIKGDDITLDSFPDGAKVTFVCDVGYRSAGGSPSVTCTAGKWSDLRMTCESYNCGPAEEVTNGQIDYPTGTEFGAEAVVICNTGYKPVGQGRYICGDQGWMGRLKTCEVTTCSPPPAVPNATFSPSKEFYEYRDVIHYSCLKDLVLGGSNSLTCSENGTFIPDPPTCTSVLCKKPDSPERNTEWAGGARPPYKHKSTVTLKCISGYKMNGSATVICEINNQWNPPLPVCEHDIPRTLGIVFGVPGSKSKLWSLSFLMNNPTCLEDSITVRCGSTAGSIICYSWYEQSRRDVLLRSSSDLYLTCGTLEMDCNYYCTVRYKHSK
ncbi:membrane cofactor protein-like isoform X4 [Salarias fasciatus]|uniref:membrane cofactor protein-like isoform X4 n=1 Tax=Salarias fasciatus TaxID=181472 RepID=UPI001176C46C|nr:membrane cofactor protein-like isoform X4 [Salarias fasciatus]